MEDVIDISSENLKLLKEEAVLVKPEALMRFIRVFSELSNQIKYSSQKRILIEIAIIKLCRPAMEQDYESLMQRMDDLEKKIESGTFTVTASAAGSAKVTDLQQGSALVRKQLQLPKAIPEDIQNLVKNWNVVLGDLGGLVRNYLKQAHLSLGGGNVLLIVLEDTVAVAFLSEEEHLSEIREAIEKNIGKQVEISVTANETGQPFGEVYADLEQLIQMDIVVEEDSEGGF